MKSLLIIILSLTLMAGAWLSKPSERSFREMMHRKAKSQTREERTVVDEILRQDKTEQFLSQCKFKNRVFWATVEKDGRRIYTGVFNTWFPADLKIEKAQL